MQALPCKQEPPAPLSLPPHPSYSSSYWAITRVVPARASSSPRASANLQLAFIRAACGLEGSGSGSAAGCRLVVLVCAMWQEEPGNASAQARVTLTHAQTRTRTRAAA